MPIHRAPWTPPSKPELERIETTHVLALSLGDPYGQAVAACRARMPEASQPRLSLIDTASAPRTDDVIFPALFTPSSVGVVCDDPFAIARALAPELFPDAVEHDELLLAIREDLIDAVYLLGQNEVQAAYEEAFAALRITLASYDDGASRSRFLLGDRPRDICFADFLLFAFLIRIDPVYFELYKASAFLLRDLPALEGYARDLFELPELFGTTEWSAIKQHHYLNEPVLNPRQIVPKGGVPDLHAPSFRAEKFSGTREDAAVEEDQSRRRGAGEWVRPQSGLRHWITPDPEAHYAAEAGRYHLYAPYNCPWSHRALLARGVLGLEEVVGASIVYFRRDPEHGWQFNPAIPGCTADQLYGERYVRKLYERDGAEESSVPILWDATSETIVSNESAEILRMFNSAFGDLARPGVDLYPEDRRREIDRVNALVYQRINNGAYKAGFANDQSAYEQAFLRYFAGLDWLEELLDEREWIAATPAFSEADLRLFPTLFRHDDVYYARFKLDLRRMSDYPRLERWVDRMLSVPGVAESSNLDHARNGYFGRTGNEIVPAGPSPLGLSRSDYPDDVWLNEMPRT